ncbi:MAG: hypothetical protein GXP26_10550 [Planctomycetes bacterium]|nr:hypothetical protein [Planctomycetota bacterium]
MNRKLKPTYCFFAIVAACILRNASGNKCLAGDLYVGGATVSITPDQPVALAGQMSPRIATKVETELTATALAIETRDGDKSQGQAILVSCDLVYIPSVVLNTVRERIESRIPGFDPSKLVLSATHTHTAPVLYEGIFQLPAEGIITPNEYVDFLADRLAEAVVSAWQKRKAASVGWGLGHAVVAYNRRSVYADRHAQMYGSMQREDFREVEGPEDHGVEVLFFWDEQGQLTATAVNVACPSQEAEGGSEVNADFWHQVRESLHAKYGKDLAVLGWTGAAGDQSPHLRYRRQAEERMRRLRGIDRLQEISRRIVLAWEEAYAGAKQERHSNVPLIHEVKTIELPVRKITEAEAKEIRAKVAKTANDRNQFRWNTWRQDAIDRYERQQAGNEKIYPMELHAIRLGDIAIATNDFELFTQFGIQMKARSKALQTFVIQLAGPGTYVPTATAASGGGYSAIVESNEVGPEGGQVLVEYTVKLINSLWPDEK